MRRVPADAVDFIRDALRQFEMEGDVVSELKAMLYLVDLQMVLSLLGAFAIYLMGDSKTARKYLDQAEKRTASQVLGAGYCYGRGPASICPWIHL